MEKINIHCNLYRNVIKIILVGLFYGVFALPSMGQSNQQPKEEVASAQNIENLTHITERDHMSSALDEIISVDFKKASLLKALKVIAGKADLRLAYNTQLSSLKNSVTVSIKDVTVEQVLGKVLENTDLRFVVSSYNHLVVMKSNKKSEKKENQFQQVEAVSGTVTDGSTGKALPGVNIKVKGTSAGTFTDDEGHYELGVASLQDTLVFSFVGYQTQEVPINGRTTIDLSMKTQALSGKEMVVVGYGTRQKKDLTGSVSQVKAEDITATPTESVVHALKGRIAGVRVTQNSGAPGSSKQVRIRGANSILASNNPLYVVDGFPVTGGVDFLNPSDIQSIDVLKDASATAIYGSRGANGVVIITTKEGTKNKGSVNFEGYYGIQNAINRFDLMNAKQFAKIANEYAINAGNDPIFDLNNIGNINTNWQDVVLQPAPMQNYTLSFNGGNDNTQYNISGNYFNKEGIIIKSGDQRGTMNLNLDQKINEVVNIKVNFALSRQKLNSISADNTSRGNGALSAAYVSPPLLAPFDSNGNYTEVAQFGFSPNVLQNPLAYAQIKNNRLNTKLLGNVSADVTLYKGLNLKISAGSEQNYIDSNYYSPSILNGSPNGSASTSIRRNISYLNENLLTYETTVRKVDQLTFTGGFTWQTYVNKYNSSGGSGFSSDKLTNNNLSAAETISPNSSSVSNWTLLSGLGRLNYSFSDKYLLTATLRSDGSSRFGENHKWGTFPSGAFAWRLSNESFIKKMNFFSNLKWRISYGATGNTAISPYQSLGRLSDERATLAKSDIIGFAPSSIANPDLRWETTYQFDTGLDIGILNQRLRITADYYKKNTKNLLVNIPLPGSVGFSNVTKNIGEVKNSGLEVGINSNILQGNFNWDIFGQISFNDTKVGNIGGSNIIVKGPNGYPTSSLTKSGLPVGVFYGFIEDGLDEQGFIKYKDLNGDGNINDGDRTVIGEPYPNFIYSLNQNFNYKSFSLNVFIEGVYGKDISFGSGANLANSFNRGENQFADVFYHHWTPDNPNPHAKYPKIGASTQFRYSDRYIKDGSYARLKNIKLSYNVPISIFGANSAVQTFQLYISGKNIYTLTSYPGLDPEVNTKGGSLLIGIDKSAYPSSKIYTFGIKIGL